ncbi:hypothetical protein CLOSTASPAR_04433 [[Clostridium] asparagiforme DSM 15981]|jgi:hypothetical protein|uniref:Uncharacterized protein n=1 Tax=[Clostridium] asparagiforme DSM 15981 TaxID=518636 RepID=C0D587_9FIRM|nr:hypothetical protein CLOSTASPAR_04433 [[Clostridium] asparagiforme DSM 15981]
MISFRMLRRPAVYTLPGGAVCIGCNRFNIGFGRKRKVTAAAVTFWEICVML